MNYDLVCLYSCINIFSCICLTTYGCIHIKSDNYNNKDIALKY